MLPGNFNNYQNFSGINSNITNNINIKNVNIISCNDSSLFNHENNSLEYINYIFFTQYHKK